MKPRCLRTIAVLFIPLFCVDPTTAAAICAEPRPLVSSEQFNSQALMLSAESFHSARPFPGVRRTWGHTLTALRWINRQWDRWDDSDLSAALAYRFSFLIPLAMQANISSRPPLSSKDKMKIQVLLKNSRIQFSDAELRQLLDVLRKNRTMTAVDLGLKLKSLDDLLKTLGITDVNTRHMFVYEFHEKFGSVKIIDRMRTECAERMKKGVVISFRKLFALAQLKQPIGMSQLDASWAPPAPVPPKAAAPVIDPVLEARKKEDKDLAVWAEPILREAKDQVPYVSVGIETLTAKDKDIDERISLHQMPEFHRVLARYQRTELQARILNAVRDLKEADRPAGMIELQRLTQTTREQIDSERAASLEVEYAVKPFLFGWVPPESARMESPLESKPDFVRFETRKGSYDVHLLMDAQGRAWSQGRWVYKEPEGWGIIVSLEDRPEIDNESKPVQQPGKWMTIRLIGIRRELPNDFIKIDDAADLPSETPGKVIQLPDNRLNEVFRNRGDLAKAKNTQRQRRKHLEKISALLQELAPISKKIADNSAQVYETLFRHQDQIEHVRTWFKKQTRRFVPSALFGAFDEFAKDRLPLVAILAIWLDPSSDAARRRGPGELSSDELNWFNELAEVDRKVLQMGRTDWLSFIVSAREALGLFTNREDLLEKLIKISDFDRPATSRMIEGLRRQYADLTGQSA